MEYGAKMQTCYALISLCSALYLAAVYRIICTPCSCEVSCHSSYAFPLFYHLQLLIFAAATSLDILSHIDKAVTDCSATAFRFCLSGGYEVRLISCLFFSESPAIYA